MGTLLHDAASAHTTEAKGIRCLRVITKRTTNRESTEGERTVRRGPRKGVVVSQSCLIHSSPLRPRGCYSGRAGYACHPLNPSEPKIIGGQSPPYGAGPVPLLSEGVRT